MSHVTAGRPLPRLAAKHLAASAEAMPVAVIMGARQTGKSTLVRSHATFGKYLYVTLDTADIRAQAKTDPRDLLHRAPRMVLDEIQRAPDLVIALKELIDQQAHERNRTAGQFVLTGSANLLTMRRVNESLAGRATYTTLWPMTRREQLGHASAGIWSDLFDTPVDRWYDLVLASTAPAADWREHVRIGGYPTPALELSTPAQRSIWFQGYIDTYLDRDVRDIADISSTLDLRRLMRIASHRVGQLVNRSAWALEAGVAATTAHRYLDLLEQSYQLIRIEAFSANRTKRLIKSPKAYWSDPGLAYHLAESPPFSGFHFENLVLCDLIAWRDSLPTRAAIMHWRTTNQDEVDFVIELSNGSLLPVECKSGERATHADTKGLRLFLDDYRAAPGGLVLHGGAETFWIADRILAAPWWRVL